MNYTKWLDKNTSTLLGKTVAITGSTGGIGKALCRHIAALGANLILVDRNRDRSALFASELSTQFPIDVQCVTADLSEMDSVRAAVKELSALPVDMFIHNAGAYSIPRKVCDTGYDNVFQINFVSPYYIIKGLLPTLRARQGRVVVVGSIAHNYSRTDPNDVDFKTRKAASHVYGNAKRYLMFSLYSLFENESDVTLSVTHPGISFTGITSHYPKLIFAIIKYPMKIIFMKPKKASLSVLRGLFDKTNKNEWIGPRIFSVWGLPKKTRLKTVPESESKRIFETAERIYSTL